jgi:hypothetical protein
MAKRKSWEVSAAELLSEVGSGVGDEPPRWAEVSEKYSVSRYLKHLTPGDLCERATGLIDCYYASSSDGYFRPDFLDPQTYCVADLLVETLVEAWFQLDDPYFRELVTIAFDRRYIPTKEVLEVATRVLSSVPEPDGEYIVKYGREGYLRALVDKGSWLIRPSAYYAVDPSLNRAQSDSEGVVELALPTVESVEHITEAAVEYGLQLEVTEAAKCFEVRISYPVAPYVFCASRRLLPRLFDDFNAEACIVIHDIQTFYDRMGGALKVASGSPAMAAVGPVKYYDPVNTECDLAWGPFLKHYRFMYQQEHRLFWTPTGGANGNEDLRLEMGSLRDCCEMINLEAR